ALRPGSAEAHSILGLTFFWKGDLDKAIAGYRRAVAIDRKFSVAHSNLARAMQSRGDLDGAIRGFNKALALDSKSASVHNELAWLLATCPDPKRRDPRQAVAHAKQAVELESKDGTFWNTLGVAHYRTGNWKVAVEALEKSMALRNGGDGNDW